MRQRSFRLFISLDNEAFANGNEATETARILRNVATRIESGEFYGHFLTIRDANGNDVGRFAAKDVSQF
jgi:hypothetical protein